MDELELDFIARNLTPAERSCALPRCLRCRHFSIAAELDYADRPFISVFCSRSHWLYGDCESVEELACCIADNLTCNDFVERD